MFKFRLWPWVLLLVLLACSAPPRPAVPAAVGLSAEYFAAGDWRGPALQRVEARLALAGAVPGLPPGPLSARYQGWLVAPRGGAYTLTLEGVGQARLSLGGQAVEGALPLQLQARLGSAPVELRVEYRAPEAPARLRLDWEGPGQPREAVPPTALRPLAVEGPKGLRAAGVGSQALSRGVELLWNPGFEQGTTAWVELAGGSFAAVAPGRTGGLAAATQNWVYAAQPLPYAYVQVGPTYTLEGWARSPQGAACVIGVKGGDASAITFDYPLTFSGADWQSQSRSFTLPPGTLWAEVYLQAQAGPAQGCAFDDLSLFAGARSPLAPAPGLQENRLQNPGFEQGLAPWNLATGSAQTPAGGLSGQMLAYQAWSWVYQIVPLTGLAPGQRLVLKGWVQNPANQACTLGLQGGNETAITFDAPFHYRALDWTEVYTEVSLPPGTTWLGAYLAGPTGCRFDELALGVPVATGQPVNPQITLDAPHAFAGSTLNFEAYGSGPEGSSYTWNFGDGTTGQGEAVYKQYTQPGYYDVSLTVSVPNGQSASTSIRIAVLPEVHDIPATRATTGDSITFDVKFPLPGFIYRHSFSDGTTLEGARVTKTFSALGFYDYTLTILDNREANPQGSSANRVGRQSSQPRVVYVARSRVNIWRPRPVAKIEASTLGGSAPLLVGFSAAASTGSGSLSYSWDFGDGTTSTLVQPSKTFTTQGRYLVTLTVTDQKGQTDTKQVFIFVRDPGVIMTMNVNYPSTSGQSLGVQQSDDPGANFVPRRSDANRSQAPSEVTAQNTGYLNFFPYAFPRQNAQLRATVRGYNNTKLIRPGVRAYWNGFEEAPGFSWDLFCPTDPDICDVAFFNPGYFVPILNANQFTFINVSQVFQAEYNIFSGLRVPRVIVSVLPDTQLPGDLASPFLREYTVVQNGRTELLLQVVVRASEAQSGLVTFEVPVYAVNNQGQHLSNINGIFKARFKNLQSEPGSGVMVAGKSSIRVTLPITSYSQTSFDLTQIEVFANPSCGNDTTFATTLRSHLNGCGQVTASPEAPGNLANVPTYPYRLPTDFQSRFNRILVGSDAQQREAYDRNLKDLPGSVARFVIGFIPILGDGVDLVEQAYNAAVGNNVDPVMTTLAAAGLGLDLFTGGAGDLTAIFKGVYRLSLETGGLLAQVIRSHVSSVLSGTLTPRQFLDNLGGRFGKVVDLARAPGCGSLGLECVARYDQVALAVKNRDGLQNDQALGSLDTELGKASQKRIDPSCYFAAITSTTVAAGGLGLAEAGVLLLGLPPGSPSGQGVGPMAAANRCNYKAFQANIIRAYPAKYANIPRAELEKTKPHHIVPLTLQDPRKCKTVVLQTGGSSNACDEARRILSRAGIDLNNPANGVLLPDRRGQLPTYDVVYPGAMEHCCLHTEAYFSKVHEKLAEVESRFASNPALLAQKVREELEKIADGLLAGSFR